MHSMWKSQCRWIEEYMAKKKKPKRDTSNWTPEVQARELTDDEVNEGKLFGVVLGEIRKNRQMTQAEFATLIGTSRSQVERMITDLVDPRLSQARRIANALGVPLYRFWDGKPTRKDRGPTPEQWQFLDLYEQLPKSDRELLVTFMRAILQDHAERLGIK